MTIALHFGHWAGFSAWLPIKPRRYLRLVCGWVALSIYPVDFDEIIAAGIVANLPLAGELPC